MRGGLKFVTFDENRAITRKQYKIDIQFLLKSNRKSYALYQMAMFSMTLGNPKPPQFLHFFVAFQILVVSKHRDFMFGVQVDSS